MVVSCLSECGHGFGSDEFYESYEFYEVNECGNVQTTCLRAQFSTRSFKVADTWFNGVYKSDQVGLFCAD